MGTFSTISLRVTTLTTLFLVRMCSAALASSVVAESTFDGGGLHTSSANYAFDNTVGGIGGIVSASTDTNKNGYIGQLAEVVSVTITSEPDSVGVGSTSQLSGTATLDDGTADNLSGTDVVWSTLNEPYPITSISGGGVLSPADVYYVAPAAVDAVIDGYYLGASNTTTVAVYAPDSIGDGIPDWWRQQYYGSAAPTNSSDCATCDSDGTGQDNLFKFVAGLNPTNPSSVFLLTIAPVPGHPMQKALTYSPVIVGFGQSYTVQFGTNLVGGVYTNLAGYSGPANSGTQATVTDLNATQPQKFYRVNISLP